MHHLQNLRMIRRILFSFLMIAGSFIQTSFSQNLTVGFLNGTGFSDPHGDFYSGRWKNKPGPVTGLSFNYSLNDHLSIQSELNYTNQYYSFVDKVYYYYQPFTYRGSNVPGINTQTSTAVTSWDLTFLRLPLFFTISTGTKLKLGFSAGGYISFLLDHDGEMPYNYIGPMTDAMNSIYMDPLNYNFSPPKIDKGLFASISISYPITEHIIANVNGRYLAGKKRYLDYENIHLGVAEWTAGISYAFLKNKKGADSPIVTADTSTHKLRLQLRSGYAISWNGGANNHNSYLPKSSMTGGISVEWLLDKSFSLQMDILYRRLGYRMKDSSWVFFRYSPNNNSMYLADTRIDLDYLLVPLLLKVKLGGPLSVYFNTGPYFSMLLNASVSGTAYLSSINLNGYSYSKTNVFDRIESYFKPMDAGWVYGLGCKIPFSQKFALDVEVRYEKGDRNVFDSSNFYDQANSKADGTMHNESLSLILGVNFPF